MRKLWLRWAILAVFVAVLALVFVRLGEWQLHRLEARRQSNARVVAHKAEPIVDWTQHFTGTIRDDQQWARVTVTGTYEQANTLRVRYRNVGDAAGTEIVTPIITADGRRVLIDRGFIARPDNKTEVDAPPAPSGTVTVIGYVRRDENGKSTATKPVDGNVRLINAPMISQTLGIDLADGYIQAISSTPADSSTLTPIGLPELTEGPHFSYALQWFLFTVVAVGGGIVLVRGDLADRKKKQQRALAAQQAAQRATATEAAAPEPTSTEATTTQENTDGPGTD